MTELFRAVEGWVREHDVQTQITSLWVLCIGFQAWSWGKCYSWWQIVRQHDRTDVGRYMKWQLLAEFVMGQCMSAAYALTLIAHHAGHQFGVWERVFVRLFVMVGIVGAVLWGVRLVTALRRANEQAKEARHADPGH